MVIEINKDIDRYQETLALGLTAKQLFFSVASLLLGGAIVLLVYPYIGYTLSAYVAIPVVTPLAMGGFYTYNEMDFFEVMRRKYQLLFRNKTLCYVSTEQESRIREFRKQE